MPLQLCLLSSIVQKSSGISFLYDRPLKFSKTHKCSNTHFGWKNAKRSALPSEVTRQRRHGRRLTLTCLPIKIRILCPNQAQNRGEIRNQQNVYKLRLMPQPLTLVKIVDRILYRTDGVTQVSVADTTIFVWIRVGSVEMNCFPFYDNIVVQYLKTIFGKAKSIVNFQDRRLAWVNNPTANRGGHPEIISSCGEIWFENRSHPASDRRKMKGKLRFTTQNKHRGGWRSFWKPIVGRHFDGKNWFSEADSPLEIQINFARCHWKSISKPISLNEKAHGSWQRTLRGRCNLFNHWGKEVGQ